MRNYIPVIALIGAFAFSSCSEEQNDVNPVPQSIINLSLDLFDGEVLQKKQEEEDGVKAWEVEIRNSQGSVVVLYWTVNQETLLKLKGDIGPFDYDVQPGNQLVNFSTAQTVAVGAIKNSALVKWELAQDEDFIGDWVYSFEFDGAKKVYVNAKSGDVLQVD